MRSWLDRVDLDHPCWTGFRDALTGLDGKVFPDAEHLNARLCHSAVSGSLKPIRFVSASALGRLDYESHIYQTGEVSTREESWHDLFNALCWHSWPELKSAMNRRHHHSMGRTIDRGRSAERDTLTLFDECGVVLVSTSRDALAEVASHQWQRVFDQARPWNTRYRIFIAGHAMLEKFLQPYKAMTANALLVQVPQGTYKMPRKDLQRCLDRQLGQRLAFSELLQSTRELAALPLVGIPGWWPHGPQDRDFYNDKSVFRPPPKNGSKGQVIQLQC